MFVWVCVAVCTCVCVRMCLCVRVSEGVFVYMHSDAGCWAFVAIPGYVVCLLSYPTYFLFLICSVVILLIFSHFVFFLFGAHEQC